MRSTAPRAKPLTKKGEEANDSTRKRAIAVAITFMLGVGLVWYALDWLVALGTALLWVAKDLSDDYRERNSMANIVVFLKHYGEQHRG